MILLSQKAVSKKYGKKTPVGALATFPRLVLNDGTRKVRVLTFFAANSNIGSVMTTKIANPAQQYICIDENVGKHLYSYFNEVLGGEEAQSFEGHLLLCFRCQESLLALDSVFDTIRANREQWLSSKEQSKTVSGIKTERE